MSAVQSTRTFSVLRRNERPAANSGDWGVVLVPCEIDGETVTPTVWIPAACIASPEVIVPGATITLEAWMTTGRTTTYVKDGETVALKYPKVTLDFGGDVVIDAPVSPLPAKGTVVVTAEGSKFAANSVAKADRQAVDTAVNEPF